MDKLYMTSQVSNITRKTTFSPISLEIEVCSSILGPLRWSGGHRWEIVSSGWNVFYLFNANESIGGMVIYTQDSNNFVGGMVINT